MTRTRLASTHSAARPPETRLAATSRLLRISPKLAIASNERGDSSWRTATACTMALSSRQLSSIAAITSCCAAGETSSTASWRWRFWIVSIISLSAGCSPVFARDARSTSSSVTVANAETTTSRSRSSRPTIFVRRWIASASRTDVPPNLITTRGMGGGWVGPPPMAGESVSVMGTRRARDTTARSDRSRCETPRSEGCRLRRGDAPYPAAGDRRRPLFPPARS